MNKKKLLIADIIQHLDEKYKIEKQLEYDNSGFQLGDKNIEITSIVLTLDVTKEAIALAKREKANLIISHHPLLFYPVKNIIFSNNDVKLDYINALIKDNIAVYSLHTNYDIYGPLREYWAKEFENTVINKNLSDDLMIVFDIPPLDFDCVKKILNNKNIKIMHGHNTRHKYTRIAYINGAGGRDESITVRLLQAKVDLFFTSEMKHSLAILLKDSNIDFIELNHAEMENPFIELIKNDILQYNKSIVTYSNYEKIYSF